MELIVRPGRSVGGEATVPGDKSIAHRWLILAATAVGRSRIEGLPPSLDVRSTAACLSRVAGTARPGLEVWSRNAAAAVEPGGSTWNEGIGEPAPDVLEVEGEGRDGLTEAPASLDCGNSGTSMRLLVGLLAAAPFRSVLVGDASLGRRPMERVAAPLRAMGADVRTEDGHAPVTVEGRRLHGVRHVLERPSAQVKSAVLLAGLAADGTTTVVEPAATRDHTEVALEALGAPIVRGAEIEVRRYQHGGFDARVPGDPSSAAFLIGAAALTGGSVTIRDVGLNPTRLAFLDVLTRMGVTTTRTVDRSELGEPVGSVTVAPGAAIRPVRIEPRELPLVIDEVPLLAVLAAFAGGESWFLDAAELRVKESDRLGAIADGIRALGGHAAGEGTDLVIAGGGLEGGVVDAGGDHRIAMAFSLAGLAAAREVRIRGAEAADVSFPGFPAALAGIGIGTELV
jgi:3-phosphoshikimate 1-carboxyvinyltransferase